jgi:hypothetical protein
LEQRVSVKVNCESQGVRDTFEIISKYIASIEWYIDANFNVIAGTLLFFFVSDILKSQYIF